jgi:hypothetical protein
MQWVRKPCSQLVLLSSEPLVLVWRLLLPVLHRLQVVLLT